MSYQVHNFVPDQVLTAGQLNEMDAQIATNEALGNGSITYISEQTLTDEQKTQARLNMGLTFTETQSGEIVIGG